MLTHYTKQWFGNIQGDLLSGLVVGLALVPEAIAFSVIAGVDPSVGLYAAFSMAVVTAFVGGRPAMVSAATGAMALLMVTLVKDHGLQYLFATTILTGIIQIILGKIKIAKLMRFVSQSVVLGFVNALGILIFMAQLPEIWRGNVTSSLLVAFGLVILYLFPKLPKIGQILPSPLICILVITLLTLVFGLDIRTVGDMGQLPHTLPVFLIPQLPITLETFLIIAPYAFAMAFVGLLESMMTCTLVDEMTHTTSNKHQECIGQGIANITTGFMGGMAGCAMIGQSIINVKSGGRGRLSTFFAGVFLLVLVVFIHDWLKIIPMASLIAVMLMVAMSTFNWNSVTQFKQTPLSSNIVMLCTVVVVLFTHNLALGVITGVILSALFLMKKLENKVNIRLKQTESTTYFIINGALFFSSCEKLEIAIENNILKPNVILDFSDADIMDKTTVEFLVKLNAKFEKANISCQFVHLNVESQTLFQRFNTHIV